MRGLLLKTTGSRYLVKADDGKIFLCGIRGLLRMKGFEATNPVSVGDHVEIEVSNNEGVITKVHERKNYIIRKSVKLSKQVQIIASNLDRAFVIATPVLPKTSLGFIDRFLATAEAYSIPAGIIFNKSDVYDETVWEFVNELKTLYEKINYKVFVVSALNESTLIELKSELKDKVTLFSGHSGVGKSSIVNALIPELKLKVSPISNTHQTGIHTTTFAEMHELPSGGYIIDTPGIREFGTIDFDRFEVSHFFPDIFSVSKNCKYNNCIHLNETECAVLDAVEKGEIALSRYQSYLSILNNEDYFN